MNILVPYATKPTFNDSASKIVSSIKKIRAQAQGTTPASKKKKRITEERPSKPTSVKRGC